MNLQQARINMVEQQIRPWEVLDQRVLDHMRDIPREDFVPPEYRGLAYADIRVPIGHGQVMMAPREEARLLQALDIGNQDKVLEIGTGSGYLTALIASLCREVVSVECHADLGAAAAEKLEARHVSNVTMEIGDGGNAWPSAGPYDAIAVTGSLPVIEERFKRQLRRGGRLFVIVGEAPAMEAWRVTRVSATDWSGESLFETVIPPLIGVARPKQFVL